MPEFAIYPSLKGKTVYISGGASGIGAETVAAFAAQGAKVGFLDLDEAASAALVDKLDSDVIYEICDLRNIDQSSGQITGIGRLKSGICQTFTCTVR